MSKRFVCVVVGSGVGLSALACAGLEPVEEQPAVVVRKSSPDKVAAVSREASNPGASRRESKARATPGKIACERVYGRTLYSRNPPAEITRQVDLKLQSIDPEQRKVLRAACALPKCDRGLLGVHCESMSLALMIDAYTYNAREPLPAALTRFARHAHMLDQIVIQGWSNTATRSTSKDTQYALDLLTKALSVAQAPTLRRAQGAYKTQIRALPEGAYKQRVIGLYQAGSSMLDLSMTFNTNLNDYKARVGALDAQAKAHAQALEFMNPPVR